MKAISLDLRQRIAAAVDGGMSQNAAARRFGVSASMVNRLLARRRASGTLQAKPRPGAKRRVAPEQHVVLAAQMRRHRQASLEEHARLWQEEQGSSLSDTTLWRTLKRMKWSHKKRVSVPVSATRRAVKNGKTQSPR